MIGIKRTECVIPYSQISGDIKKGRTELTFSLPIEIDFKRIRDFSANTGWNGVNIVINEITLE